MFDSPFSFTGNVLLFALAGAVIALIGPRLATVADQLADRTGLGEAITGSVFLGASTSLPGTVAILFAASDGQAEFAVSTAIGGIPVQAAFLGVADLAHRRANLEHAAASHSNMLIGTLLIILLTISLLAVVTPSLTLFNIHIATPALFVTYLGGLWIARSASDEPMWEPRRTTTTEEDVPDEGESEGAVTPTLALFILFALVVAGAGWTIGWTGVAIAEDTGLNASVVGGIFVAATTSVPELVTSISAVRKGALTMAVAGIVGGNSYDSIAIGMADVAYRDGSVYHAAPAQTSFLLAWSIMLSSVIMFGLLRRERRGLGGIGLEGWLLPMLYISGAIVLATSF